MPAVFEVISTGIESLNKTIQALERSSLAQERLQAASISATKALGVQVASGFQLLSRETAKNTAVTLANTTAKEASIVSVKQLSAALAKEAVDLSLVNDALVTGKVAAINGAEAMTALSVATSRSMVRMREMAISTETNAAASNQLAAAYSKVAASAATRMNIESGAAAVLTKRLATEQALTAVAAERAAVDRLATVNLQTQIVANSGLTNSQKMRALSTLGLIELETAVTGAENRHTAATLRMTEAQLQAHSAMRGVGAATGNIMLTYGRMLPLISTFVATMLTLKSIKVGTEFDYLTKYSDAISDHTVTLEKLQTTLLNMKGLGKGPLEIADGYRELVKAGYSAEESLNQLSYATKFAVVSEMSMGDATQSLVGLTRAFGRDGITMADTADIIGKAALASSTDVSEMSSAMSHLTELSTVADISLTEAATAMALLANAGIRGSKGATAIRTSVLKLLEPTDAMKKAMDAAGVSIDAISDDGKIKGMKELFISVQKILDVIPKREQVGFLADMFDLRSLKGAANLLESIRTGSWDEMEQSLLHVKGVVGELHGELQKSSKFWADELSASFSRALIAANDAESVTAVLKDLNAQVSDPGFSEGMRVLSTTMLLTANAMLSLFSAVGTAGGAIINYLGKLGEVLYPGTKGRSLVGDIADVERSLGLIGPGGPSLQPSHTTSKYGASPGLSSGHEPLTPASARGYATTTLNATVIKDQEERDKAYASALKKVASLNPDSQLKEALQEAESDRLAAVYKIENEKTYKDLDPLIKKREIDKANKIAELEKKYAREQYGKRSTVGATQTMTASNALSQLSDISYQVMPAGRDKEMAALTKTYQDNSDKIKLVAASHKSLGAEAAKAQKIQDEAFAAGKKNIDTKYITEYADKLDDLKNGLDSIGSRDKALSAVVKESEKIDVSFAKWRNSATAAASSLDGDTTPAAAKLRGEISKLVEESYKLQPAMKEAFSAELIKDAEKAIREFGEQYDSLSEYDSILKGMTDTYDNIARGIEKNFKGTAQYDIEMNKLNATFSRVKQNSIELGKASDNLWSGFSAGVKEAEKSLQTLGTLGYNIFGDLRSGIKDTFVGALKGEFDSIGDYWKATVDKMKDHAIDFLAEQLTTKATNILFKGADSIFGGLLSGLGLGGLFGGSSGPTYSGGAMNVNVVNAGAGGGFGSAASGGFFAGLKEWSTTVFGPTITKYLGMAGGAIGLAGGAYGMYAGYKNIKAGNAGVGALQMAGGAASAYKGAVTIGLLKDGAFTTAAKAMAAKMGVAQGTAQAAAYAKTAYVAGKGATSYGTFQAAATAGKTATVGSAGASSGTGAAMAGGMAYATVAAAAVLVAKGIYDKSKRPNASVDIDRAGITPANLSQFNNTIKAIDGSVLAAIPTLAKYQTAIYDQSTQVLTLQNGVNQLRLQYDAADAAGHQWSTTITGGTSILTSAAAQIITSFTGITPAVDQVHQATSIAANAMSQLAGGSEVAASSVNALKTYLMSLGMSSSSAADAADKLMNSVSSVGNSFSTVGSAAAQAAPGIMQLINGIGGISSAANQASRSMENFDTSASTYSGHIAPVDPKYADRYGKDISYHATGGILQGGSGTKDDLYLGSIGGVAQVAMGGEYIMPQAATKKYRPILESMRREEYASGGTIGEFMQSVKEELEDLDMSDFQKSLTSVLREYNDNLKQAKELKASKSDQLLIAQLRDKKTAGVNSDHATELAKQAETLKKFNDGIDYDILKFSLTDLQIEIKDVGLSMEDTITQAKELGATEKDLSDIRKLASLQIAEINNKPLREAVDSLKSFKDSLAGTVDATFTSTQAQNKLQEVLGKARSGDFSGLSTVSEFLNDISINKSDYANALDYARAYWKTMSSVNELERLTGHQAKIPGYASGGTFPGGLRIVGETGPEIEYTGPSRIYRNDQLIDISALLEEIRLLREAVNNGNFAVAKNTYKTADELVRLRRDGIIVQA